MLDLRATHPFEKFLLKTFLETHKIQGVQNGQLVTVASVPHTPLTTSGVALSAGSISAYVQSTSEFSNLVSAVSEIAALAIPNSWQLIPTGAYLQESSFIDQATSAITQQHEQFNVPNFQDDLKKEVIKKYKEFPEVSNIFFSENDYVITFTVNLTQEQYDYDLMVKIFETAEFPIKDNFINEKLIDFEYVYSSSSEINLADYPSEEIFKR